MAMATKVVTWAAPTAEAAMGISVALVVAQVGWVGPAAASQAAEAAREVRLAVQAAAV